MTPPYPSRYPFANVQPSNTALPCIDTKASFINILFAPPEKVQLLKCVSALVSNEIEEETKLMFVNFTMIAVCADDTRLMSRSTAVDTAKKWML
jgi:hypothetical protein